LPSAKVLDLIEKSSAAFAGAPGRHSAIVVAAIAQTPLRNHEFTPDGYRARCGPVVTLKNNPVAPR